jgi:hypothetical protein
MERSHEFSVINISSVEQNSGDAQRFDRHAAKYGVGVNRLHTFFFVARWLKLLVKRLTRRHRQARNLGMVLG